MAVNVENIKRVRDRIAALPPEQFDMSRLFWMDECGTVACIAGWTLVVLANSAHTIDAGWKAAAGDLLGLPHEMRDDLFQPPGWTHPDKYPRPAVVAVLDRLIETGEVDWDYAIAKVAADSPASQPTESEG